MNDIFENTETMQARRCAPSFGSAHRQIFTRITPTTAKMVAAACIINDGSSDDRFTDFRNWLIMQGYDAYRQALIDPDNLAALNIPFRNTEWMGCGNVAWYAYAGQQLRTYFEKAGITAELHRKYPAMLELPDDLNRAIMREQLAPHQP